MNVFRTILDLPLENQALLLRLDLNVPLHQQEITSDARIVAALPTIQHAIAHKARVAIIAHLGRPKGRQPEQSLEPVGVRLSELLSQDIIFAEDCIGDGVKRLMQDARPGQVLLLENLRYHAGEEKNDPGFAKALATPFDLYINDAFGASHRSHASIVGVTKHLQTYGAGFLLQKETAALGKLLNNPGKPFVAVVGGAKVSDKLGVLLALLGRVQTLCIGGAMAYTFLKAQGKSIGLSKIEEDKIRMAQDVLQRAKEHGVQVLLPVDHIASKTFAAQSLPVHVQTPHLPDDLLGLDIGTKTRENFVQAIQSAQTIFWNGPMGVFEWPAFAAGTLAIAQAVAHNQTAYSVVGGGDSVAAVEAAQVTEKIGHISTGGGASLEFLQYGTLPGLEALQQGA